LSRLLLGAAPPAGGGGGAVYMEGETGDGRVCWKLTSERRECLTPKSSMTKRERIERDECLKRQGGIRFKKKSRTTGEERDQAMVGEFAGLLEVIHPVSIPSIYMHQALDGTPLAADRPFIPTVQVRHQPHSSSKRPIIPHWRITGCFLVRPDWRCRLSGVRCWIFGQRVWRHGY
jgi:hypothetical protein